MPFEFSEKDGEVYIGSKEDSDYILVFSQHIYTGPKLKLTNVIDTLIEKRKDFKKLSGAEDAQTLQCMLSEIIFSETTHGYIKYLNNIGSLHVSYLFNQEDQDLVLVIAMSQNYETATNIHDFVHCCLLAYNETIKKNLFIEDRSKDITFPLVESNFVGSLIGTFKQEIELYKEQQSKLLKKTYFNKPHALQ